MASSSLIRPFLKWPGGKFRLLPTLQNYLPNTPILVEPFVGAGSLFLNTKHAQVIVNDINVDLINLFRLVQNSKDAMHDAKKYFVARYNKESAYYRLRERFNQSKALKERASLFLYLNRHGYNGLCRYNAKGIYNVPFGDYKRPYFPQNELAIFYSRAQSVTFHCEDYAAFLSPFLKYPKRKLQQMTFYCDPPYSPLSKTANFTSYAQQRFTQDDQEQLAYFAQSLSHKGATVLISNHNTPFTQTIYAKAKCVVVDVRRSISCNAKARHKVSELIACFTPK